MYLPTQKMMDVLNALNAQHSQEFNKCMQFFIKKCSTKNLSERAGVEQKLLQEFIGKTFWGSRGFSFLEYCKLVQNSDFRLFNGKNYYVLSDEFFTWSK